MATDHGTSAGRDDEARVCEVLAAYFDALEAGQAPDRTEWLARHSDLAGELAAFLEAEDRLLRATEPLRATVTGCAGGSSPGPTDDPTYRFVSNGSGTAHDAADFTVHVFGNYELIGEPIQGGMSVVYRALHRGLKRPVALKMLRGGTLADREDMRRFRLEAEAVADLDHPNIVPIYEVGEHDGLCYFAMKLIEGGSLARRLAEYAPIPQVAASLMATVARAVHHAHQRGILHRDLKPSNIVIDTAGQPHVTDFGLAKRMGGDSELTQSGAILGTPSYMAPEQAAGQNKAVTTATDVYGLGGILYALLTGKPPFKGESVHATLDLVRRQPPDPPSGVGRNVDRDLETICLKCLEKDPERRYGSALAVAEDLERWLRGEPTVARPLSGPARLGRWTWRWRGRMAAAATALVMLMLIGLGTRQTIRLRQAGQLVQAQQNLIRGRDADARQAQYASDIHRASLLIAQGERKEARQILDGHLAAAGAEDIRGFEWSHLRGLIEPSHRSWAGHEGKEVYHVEYAPDGRTFATAGQDRTARIWDSETGQERLVCRGHDEEVVDARFDPRGTRLVTVGDDATVRIWSTSEAGRMTVLDRLPSPTIAALFTPDGRDVIAAARDGTLVRWDASTGRRRATCRARHGRNERWVESLAISPRGTTLALAGQGESVQLFDLSQGGLAPVSTSVANMLGTNGFCVAIAPDGRSLAATGTNDSHVVLYDRATGETQSVLKGAPTSTFTLAFAPTGRTLAVGDDRGTLRIWDLATRSCQVALLGHTRRIWCVAFSPDGRALTTTSRDGTIRLWDATPRSGRVAFRGPAQLPIHRDGDKHANSVAFSADGTQLLATNAPGCMLECDLRDHTTRTLKTADPRGDDGFSSRPFELVAGRTATSRLERQAIPSQGERPSDRTLLAPDGWNLADATDTRVRLWDFPTLRRRFLLVGHSGDVGGLAFSPDGRTLATASLDKTVRLWSVAGGQELLVLEGHTGPVHAVAFSTDGEMLGSCGDSADGGIEAIVWFAQGAGHAKPRLVQRPSP